MRDIVTGGSGQPSLLELYAGMAMQAYLSSALTTRTQPPEPATVANVAWNMAAAMMEERRKRVPAEIGRIEK